MIASSRVDFPAPRGTEDGYEGLASEVQRPDGPPGNCGYRRRRAATVSCLLLRGANRAVTGVRQRRSPTSRPTRTPGSVSLAVTVRSLASSLNIPGSSRSRSSSSALKVARMSSATAPGVPGPAGNRQTVRLGPAPRPRCRSGPRCLLATPRTSDRPTRKWPPERLPVQRLPGSGWAPPLSPGAYERVTDLACLATQFFQRPGELGASALRVAGLARP